MGRRFLSEQEVILQEEAEEWRAMLREMVNGDLADLGRDAVRQTLEDLMKEERDWVLGYLPHERLPQGERSDHRNGYYRRDLMTTFGVLPKVAVPRSRQGSYQTQILPRYQRRTRQVDEAIRQVFLAGVSTRRVGEITKTLMGEAVSAQTVSRLCQTLGAQVRAFHQRPLEDNLLYLHLDGLTMKIKGAQGVVSRVLLVALGITTEGRRYLVDFRLAPRETKEHWQAFLENLYLRGLHGDQLACITTDGNPGLIGALEIIYPGAPRQRCWVHKMRNVSNYLKKEERKEALTGMAKIYSAPNRRQALLAFREWYCHWHPIDAQAADCLKRDLEELLTIFSLPVRHRILMRTTNPLERVFVEVRRRSRPMLAFANQASCERICLSVFHHLQASWNRKPIRPITQKT